MQPLRNIEHIPQSKHKQTETCRHVQTVMCTCGYTRTNTNICVLVERDRLVSGAVVQYLQCASSIDEGEFSV